MYINTLYTSTQWYNISNLILVRPDKSLQQHVYTDIGIWKNLNVVHTSWTVVKSKADYDYILLSMQIFLKY